MHELSVAAAVVRTVVDAVPDARDVREIHLRVGALSGVVPASLQFAYDVAATGTALADAVLVVDTVAPTAWCPSCRQDVVVSTTVMVCPSCASTTPRLTGGTELEITHLVLRDRVEEVIGT